MMIIPTVLLQIQTGKTFVGVITLPAEQNLLNWQLILARMGNGDAADEQGLCGRVLDMVESPRAAVPASLPLTVTWDTTPLTQECLEASTAGHDGP